MSEIIQNWCMIQWVFHLVSLGKLMNTCRRQTFCRKNTRMYLLLFSILLWFKVAISYQRNFNQCLKWTESANKSDKNITGPSINKNSSAVNLVYTNQLSMWSHNVAKYQKRSCTTWISDKFTRSTWTVQSRHSVLKTRFKMTSDTKSDRLLTTSHSCIRYWHPEIRSYRTCLVWTQTWKSLV